jgi:hypothetical protein
MTNGVRWLALALLLVAGEASARTVVFPHVVETSGKAGVDPNSFDTTIFLTYVGGLPGVTSREGQTAQVDLYLYDEATAAPLLSLTAAAVCNPCTFLLGTGAEPTAPRKRSVNLHDEIVAKGGFPGESVGAFVILVLTGDETNVALTAAIINERVSPDDLAITPLVPQAVGASGTGGGSR